MNYQNLLCVGDSQTFGARSYGCYPLYLGRFLSERSPYDWRPINRSTNGHTARDLWFRVNYELEVIQDTYQACVLIGTNDVGCNTDPEIFNEYVRQSLRAFAIRKYKAVYFAEIPPIFPDGHVFFPKDCARRREALNERLAALVSESAIARWVELPNLTRECYEDAVHFNETGNRRVAESFAEAILSL